MLSYFPTLYEDEHLSGGLARLRFALGEPPDEEFSRHLYGGVFRPLIDVPNGIENLIANLPANSIYNAEYLIVNHTPLQYQIAFCEPEAATRLKSAVLGNNTGLLNRMLRNRWRTSGTPSYLRLCDACVDADLKSVGTIIWRRSHQLPWTFVCAQHGIALRNSSLPIAMAGFSHLHANRVLLTDQLAWSEPFSGIHQFIAENGRWLLYNKVTPLSKSGMASKVYRVLDATGWVKHGKVLSCELREKAKELLGEHLSERLGVSKPGRWHRSQTWPTFLYRAPHGDNHPTHRYLVLLATIGISADHFFSEFITDKPDPYPCNTEKVNGDVWLNTSQEVPCPNPFCKRHRKNHRSIAKSIAPSAVRFVIACDLCGHVRRWTGADRGPTVIVVGGGVWDETLRRRAMSGATQKSLACAFRLSESKIADELVRLKLLDEQQRSINEVKVDRRSIKIDRVEKAKRTIISARLADPGLTRNRIEELYGSDVRYIRKYDEEALRTILPPYAKHGRRLPDWPALDNRLVQAARRIFEASVICGAPIGKNELIKKSAKECNYSTASVYKHMSKLSHFSALLTSLFPPKG